MLAMTNRMPVIHDEPLYFDVLLQRSTDSILNCLSYLHDFNASSEHNTLIIIEKHSKNF